MKWNRPIILFTLASVCCLAVIRAASAPKGGTISFDLRDKRTVITQDLSRDLELRITKEHRASAADVGWSLSVVHKPFKTGRKNLLRHSPQAHGPYPTDVLAWISRDHYFPDERVFTVSGRPLQLALKLENPTTATEGDAASFTGGRATITWQNVNARPPHR